MKVSMQKVGVITRLVIETTEGELVDVEIKPRINTPVGRLFEPGHYLNSEAARRNPGLAAAVKRMSAGERVREHVKDCAEEGTAGDVEVVGLPPRTVQDRIEYENYARKRAETTFRSETIYQSDDVKAASGDHPSE